MNRVSIGSDNGLSPVRRQAITWTSAGLLSIGPLRINFSEIWNRNSCIFIQENAIDNVVCQIGGHFVQGVDKALTAVTALTILLWYHDGWRKPNKLQGKFMLSDQFQVRFVAYCEPQLITHSWKKRPFPFISQTMVANLFSRHAPCADSIQSDEIGN